MSLSHNEFFDEICAIVPWMTRLQASDALASVEIAFFEEYPEELRMEEMLTMPYAEVRRVELRQNWLILEEFRKRYGHYA